MAGHGPAVRRWEPLLRAWHRHMKMTVATEMAMALHNGAQPAGLVVEEPREEAGREMDDASRGLKPLPQEKLPAALVAPGPQACLVAPLCLGLEEPPLLELPTLSSSGDGVDAAALSCLLAQTLAAQEKTAKKAVGRSCRVDDALGGDPRAASCQCGSFCFSQLQVSTDYGR